MPKTNFEAGMPACSYCFNPVEKEKKSAHGKDKTRSNIYEKGIDHNQIRYSTMDGIVESAVCPSNARAIDLTPLIIRHDEHKISEIILYFV